MNACTKGFIEENKRLAEERVLAQYGMTVEDFVKSRESVGDLLYERIWGEISRIKLGCELLVGGFDNSGSSHIFVVSNPTDDNPSFVTDRDFPGFAAIGTGSYLADSALYGMDHNSALGLKATIYNLTTAKFLSESASDVGEETYLYIFGKDGEEIELTPLVEGELRKQWVRRGKPEIPKEAMDTITDALPEPFRDS
jgi:hypothetical protein